MIINTTKYVNGGQVTIAFNCLLLDGYSPSIYYR